MAALPSPLRPLACVKPFEAHAEEWGGSAADMKVKVETCLPYAAVGRAVRELEVSRTPSELLLSLISLLRRATLHTTPQNTLTCCQSGKHTVRLHTDETLYSTYRPAQGSALLYTMT